MKKRKLTLKTLSISSFITDNDFINLKTIKGGEDGSSSTSDPTITGCDSDAFCGTDGPWCEPTGTVFTRR